MAKKRYRPEEIIGKLREADVLISQGKRVRLLSGLPLDCRIREKGPFRYLQGELTKIPPSICK